MTESVEDIVARHEKRARLAGITFAIPPADLLALFASWRERGEALIDAAAHLAAAISLLERGGKKAAPSDKMFAQMLCDYKSSLDRARVALAHSKGEGA